VRAWESKELELKEEIMDMESRTDKLIQMHASEVKRLKVKY
jgi:hypothetical protein